MYFEELTLEEKTEATINYFKEKDKVAARGRKEAEQYIGKIKKQLKGEKKGRVK